MMVGIILYGPPAVGKDTVTAALHHLDNRYRQFQRAKCGSGRTTGYRMITAEQLEEIRATGEVIWENERYGSTYVVDRLQLHRDVAAGVPVLHLGQVPAVRAVLADQSPIRWLTAELWCPRSVAAQRIHDRDTGDDASRLTAYDETERLVAADLHLDTSLLTADEAAARINAALG
jgi:guanylate kinase